MTISEKTNYDKEKQQKKVDKRAAALRANLMKRKEQKREQGDKAAVENNETYNG